MKKIIISFVAFFFLTGFAGFFDCWEIDVLGNYAISRCKDGDINFRSATPSEWFPPNIMYDEPVKYTLRDTYIYIYSTPFDSGLEEISLEGIKDYNIEVDDKLKVLPVGHPDRQTEYVKINQEIGEILYFRETEKMSDVDKKIFTRLKDVYELEQEGKFERQINHHDVYGWKRFIMKSWNRSYEYPPERVDMVELFNPLELEEMKS